MRLPLRPENRLKFQPGDLPEGILYGNDAFRYPEDTTIELHSFTRSPFVNVGDFALLALHRMAPNTVNRNYVNTGTLSGMLSLEAVNRVADGGIPLQDLRYHTGADASWVSIDFNVPHNYRTEQMVGFLLQTPGLFDIRPQY